MQEYEAKKIYKGKVSVRDYIVKRCIEANDGITIRIGNMKMVMNNTELKDKLLQIHPIPFKSKFNDEKYELLEFPWNPQTVKQTNTVKKIEPVEEPSQLTLF